MRHNHGYRKLGRTSSHRAALLKNLTIAIVKAGRIETTLPKAKELRSYVEKLITRARKGDFNAHKFVFAHLQDKEATDTIQEQKMNKGKKSFLNAVAAFLQIAASGVLGIIFNKIIKSITLCLYAQRSKHSARDDYSHNG